MPRRRRRRRRRHRSPVPATLLVTVLAIVVVGCGPAGSDSEGGAGPATTTQPAPELVSPVELTVFGACGDAYVWATDAEGTVAVTASIQARDRSTAEPTVYEFALPDDDVAVDVLRGRDLTRNFCTDVIDWESEPASVDVAVAGQVRIDLDANPGEMAGCGRATVRFSFTGIKSADGIAFDATEAETTGIGCYAG